MVTLTPCLHYMVQSD